MRKGEGDRNKNSACKMKSILDKKGFTKKRVRETHTLKKREIKREKERNKESEGGKQ